MTYFSQNRISTFRGAGRGGYSSPDRPHPIAPKVKSTSSHRDLNKMLYRLTIVLFAITLSGCPGMSPRDQESFRSHINQTISNDMSFVKTIELLAKDDFSCDDRSMSMKITCTRMKHSLLPYSCIQRVNLSADAERRMIVDVTTEIACTGF